jgi:cytoskeleton protein RodZ
MTDEVERIDPAEALMREVGAQLRRVRRERGEELEEVAETLRIKPTYLYGIEQGDLSVMPGRTYALGFLRSYADYLGFDGDDLIVQIKSTVDDLTDSTRLHIRTPLPESRLPKTPLVLLSLAVVAGIYAGWSYLHYSGELGVETVAEVPENLRRLAFDRLPTPADPGTAAPPEASVPEEAPPAAAPEAEPEPEDAQPLEDAAGPGGLIAGGEGEPASLAPPPAASADRPDDAGAPPAVAEAAPGAEEEVAEAEEEPAPAVAADPRVETRLSALEPRAGPAPALADEAAPPALGGEVAAPEPAPAEPLIPEERPVAEPAADDDPLPEDTLDGSEPAEAGPDLAVEVEDEEPAPPAWPGAAEVLARYDIDLAAASAAGTPEDPVIHEPQNTDARIILRGIGTSWIRIESESGDYLRTRTLDPGDAFLVPDRDDLIMWTGNAGGIEVIVDGEVLPPLSTDGAVVRDIPLNPAELPAFAAASR